MLLQLVFPLGDGINAWPLPQLLYSMVSNLRTSTEQPKAVTALATDVGVEVVKIGFVMIGASILETSPTMIGWIGRTDVLTLIVVGFETSSAEVTLAKESGKGGQGIVMTVFV